MVSGEEELTKRFLQVIMHPSTERLNTIYLKRLSSASFFISERRGEGVKKLANELFITHSVLKWLPGSR